MRVILAPFFIISFLIAFIAGTLISTYGFPGYGAPTTGQVSLDNGDKVYRLYIDKMTPENFTGTGFAVNYDGHTYLMTAGHICSYDVASLVFESKSDGLEVLVKNKDFNVYSKNDLCVIAELDGVDAFSLASKVTTVNTYYALGHPNAYPLVATQGNILAFVTASIVAEHIPQSKCNPPRYFKHTENNNKYCMFMGPSYITSIPVIGGSSGSPVFNEDYELTGVVSTADSSSPGNWAGVVPLEEIEDFLESI